MYKTFVLIPIILCHSAMASDIEEYCQADWRDDYAMLEFCIEEQEQAKSDFLQLNGDIAKACGDEWLPDYQMALFCHDEQSAAEQRLDIDDADETTAFCHAEWKNDYAMVEFCIEEQRAARDRLEQKRK